MQTFMTYSSYGGANVKFHADFYELFIIWRCKCEVSCRLLYHFRHMVVQMLSFMQTFILFSSTGGANPKFHADLSVLGDLLEPRTAESEIPEI